MFLLAKMTMIHLSAFSTFFSMYFQYTTALSLPSQKKCGTVINTRRCHGYVQPVPHRTRGDRREVQSLLPDQSPAGVLVRQLSLCANIGGGRRGHLPSYHPARWVVARSSTKGGTARTAVRASSFITSSWKNQSSRCA